jgi:hypothetical protein
MNGALMKAASRFTIAAAFGLVLGVSSAQAADLGGNCCADLEERIADLEATTARKGNRKMSLTITGQVHRMILFWDDGQSNGTYWGLDNTNSSSRFSFTGTAKVTPSVSMGFDITIEIEAGGTSSKVNQFDEDGKLGNQINGVSGASFNASNVDAYFGDARRAAWWIEDTRLGRMTVGRYESAGAITTIDLAGIGAGASASVVLINGGFLLRGPDGQYWATSLGTFGDPAANQGRTELLRWDSPTYQGFILSASIAEFNTDYWGVMLRYANEFNGVRVAAGIGYENATDRFTSVQAAVAGAGPNDLLGPDPEVKAWGAGLSALHVPSGLFAQGHYMAAEYSCINGNPNGVANGNAPNGLQTGYWGQTTDCRKDANQWLIQAGITKNWFGFGNTALFLEYSRNNGWGAGEGSGAFAGQGRNFTGTNGSVTVNGVTDSEMTVWGAGITQNIDAAATEMYLNWRHFDADVTCNGAAVNNAVGVNGALTTAACGGAAVVGASKKLPTENFDAIVFGARVKF